MTHILLYWLFLSVFWKSYNIALLKLRNLINFDIFTFLVLMRRLVFVWQLCVIFKGNENQVQYQCMECYETVDLTDKSSIRCLNCGYRVFTKRRSNKPLQFEARWFNVNNSVFAKCNLVNYEAIKELTQPKLDKVSDKITQIEQTPHKICKTKHN